MRDDLPRTPEAVDIGTVDADAGPSPDSDSLLARGGQQLMPVCENRDELLRRIQALEFTAVDLNLYLDTHPCDARAVADFNQICQALAQTRTVYEQAFGPLMNFGQSCAGCRWTWAEGPWPWEM